MFMAPVKYKLTTVFRRLILPFISKSLLRTNEKIRSFVDGHKKEGVTLELFDAYNLFTEALNSPEKFGFKYSKKYIIPGLGRYDGEVSNIKEHGEYLFWDYVHPTTQGHKLLTKHIAELINEKFHST